MRLDAFDVVAIKIKASNALLLADAHLVLTHEAAVANNVSDQNGGEAALHGFLPEMGE